MGGLKRPGLVNPFGEVDGSQQEDIRAGLLDKTLHEENRCPKGGTAWNRKLHYGPSNIQGFVMVSLLV
jgi:hypothetical protein